jgi:hypothetical protein
MAGSLAQMLPFSAGPQLAPGVGAIAHHPLFGAIAQAAPTIANNAGYHTVGSVLSVLTSQLGAHPVGAALGQLGPMLGTKAAELFGRPDLVAVGNIAGQIGNVLPFSAAPRLATHAY